MRQPPEFHRKPDIQKIQIDQTCPDLLRQLFCFFLTDRRKLCTYSLQCFFCLLILLFQLHAVLIKMLQLFQTIFLFFQGFFDLFHTCAVFGLQSADQIQPVLCFPVCLFIKVKLFEIFSNGMMSIQ